MPCPIVTGISGLKQMKRAKFMVNHWPDENLFFELITTLFKRVKKNNGKVRAFGEMVALL